MGKHRKKTEPVKMCRACGLELSPKAFPRESAFCKACLACRTLPLDILKRLFSDRYNQRLDKHPAPERSFEDIELPTHKRCAQCLEWKPLISYYKSAEHKYGRTSLCARCANINRQRARWGKPPLQRPEASDDIGWYKWDASFVVPKEAVVETPAPIVEPPKPAPKQKGMSEELKQRLAAMQAHLHQRQADVIQQMKEEREEA